LAYLVASGIKGLTGIGFSTSCLPIMALRLDLKIAIPLVLIPSMTSNLVVMYQAGNFRQALSRFWPFYLFSIPGLLIGLSVLVVININVAKLILGIVLICYASWALWNSAFALSLHAERLLQVPAGFLTGFINGLTGSQVMPALPFMLSLKMHKNDFVQAINISFTLSSLILLGRMLQLSLIPQSSLAVALGSIVPVFAIVFIAGHFQKSMSVDLHRRIVLWFLFTMGCALALRALF
jgi:uncharacterized membrane protein YfcA